MAQDPKASGAAVLYIEIFAYNIIHKHLFEVSSLDFYAVFITMTSEHPMNVIQYKWFDINNTLYVGVFVIFYTS